MKILAIESSCDETGVAVVEKNDDEHTIRVLSNVIATSLDIHATTGGIIPETAAREQVKYILPVIQEALIHYHKKFTQCHSCAGRNPEEPAAWEHVRRILEEEIDGFAVTDGPGLIGSLLVGVETAKTLAYVFDKPIMPVNHLLAHIYANFIQPETSSQKPVAISFPFIGLIVSGGHTDLLYFKSHDNYEWLGGTRDDAAGECFDKCARLLGYEYPGGPKISKLAEQGNPKNVPLPKLMTGDDFDFSFSGLKTAFMNIVRREFDVAKRTNEHGYQWQYADIEHLSPEKQQFLYDLCASLEQTIIEVLVRKTLNAAKKYDCNTILVGGGVSANQRLVETLQQVARSKKPEATIFVSQRNYSTDNAAMIGAYAAMDFKPENWQTIKADPELYFE